MTSRADINTSRDKSVVISGRSVQLKCTPPRGENRMRIPFAFTGSAERFAASTVFIFVEETGTDRIVFSLFLFLSLSFSFSPSCPVCKSESVIIVIASLTSRTTVLRNAGNWREKRGRDERKKTRERRRFMITSFYNFLFTRGSHRLRFSEIKKSMGHRCIEDHCESKRCLSWNEPAAVKFRGIEKSKR